MKVKIILFIFMLSALHALAVEVSDTVVRYNYARSLIITENEAGVGVEVVNAAGETINFTNQSEGDRLVRSSSRFNSFSWGCCHRWHLTCGGFNFGFVTTPGVPGNQKPDMGKSMEIGWLNIIALERQLSRNWSLSIGVGVDWRNYRSTTGLVFLPEEDFKANSTSAAEFDRSSATGEVLFSGEMPENYSSAVAERLFLSGDVPEGYRFSRIKIFSVQFPLLFTKTFKRIAGLKPAIGFGPIFNCNPHGSVKTSWKVEQGKNRSYSSDRIGQRKFTIDFYAQVSLGSFGLYARYSPYKILTGPSPDYRTLSTGLILFY